MDESLLCRWSDPAHPPHMLSKRRSSDKRLSICFLCKGKHLRGRKYYYSCDTCNLEFHEDCLLFGSEIKHPYHPSHLLTLIKPPTVDRPKLFVDEDSDDDDYDDFDYGDDDDDDDDYNDFDDSDDDYSVSEENHRCNCCQRRLEKRYYHCSICNFSLNWSCSQKRPDPIISHTKSHSHPFNLFPIRISSPCDACGLSLEDTRDCVYSCLPCSHLIHKKCIYLPRVIKITRHHHRLSFTSSLFVGDLFCGVCRKEVDPNYGRFSCQRGCQYAVHSKCATREDVWDGKDLEGVPEEPEEDIEPFVRIDEETILHFSHEHYLKLREKKNINEKTKFCEACCIPIRISQRFYGCMECDFVLDEACASLPRKIDLPLHKHPFTLHPSPVCMRAYKININARAIVIKGLFDCNGCQLHGCGFEYRCVDEYCDFQLDVRCAALPDPFIHGCHPQDHPLFFNLTEGICMRCSDDDCSSYFLECIKCQSFLGLNCATLPSVAHYQHDRHPLTLSYGEETSGQYWCEKCEKKLDSKKWFYTCEACRTTLHVKCLLEKDIFMKPNHIIEVEGCELKTVLNDGNSRLVCFQCHRRCEEMVVLNGVDDGTHFPFDESKYFCTLRCMGESYLETVRSRRSSYRGI